MKQNIKPKKRSPFILPAVFLLLIAFGLGYLLFKKSPPPNVILIMVDTLRADYLGCYGFQGPISPTIDALAQESVLFKNARAPAPWTKPSIASLFTSLYSPSHQVTDHGGEFWKQVEKRAKTDVLPEEALTLAEVLQEAGYQTAGFNGNPWLRSRYGFNQGFEFYGDSQALIHKADTLFKPVQLWLEHRPQEKPFFLYLHFMDVHGPYQCPEEDRTGLETSESLGEERTFSTNEVQAIPSYLIPNDVTWTQKELASRRHWRLCYATGIKIFDQRLKAIFDYLKQKNVYEDALIIFTSDHGEALDDHGQWDHGDSLYYHQLDVPLLIRFPRAKHQGKEIKNMVSLVDVMPTILDVAEEGIPSIIQHGSSLLPLIHSPEPKPRSGVLAHAVKHQPFLYALEQETEKLIMNMKNKKTSYFQRDTDPREKNDLSQTKPEQTNKMKAQLEKILDAITQTTLLPKSKAHVPAETQEQLKSLGYLQ